MLFGNRVSEGDRLLDRRVGLEQEFFLVEESGRPSKRADEFLERCQAVTEVESGSAACFAPEFVLGLVEVNTPPVHTLSDLEREYARLRVAPLRQPETMLGERPVERFTPHAHTLGLSKRHSPLRMGSNGGILALQDEPVTVRTAPGRPVR